MRPLADRTEGQLAVCGPSAVLIHECIHGSLARRPQVAPGKEELLRGTISNRARVKDGSVFYEQEALPLVRVRNL